MIASPEVTRSGNQRSVAAELSRGPLATVTPRSNPKSPETGDAAAGHFRSPTGGSAIHTQ